MSGTDDVADKLDKFKRGPNKYKRPKHSPSTIRHMTRGSAEDVFNEKIEKGTQSWAKNMTANQAKDFEYWTRNWARLRFKYWIFNPDATFAEFTTWFNSFQRYKAAFSGFARGLKDNGYYEVMRGMENKSVALWNTARVKLLEPRGPGNLQNDHNGTGEEPLPGEPGDRLGTWWRGDREHGTTNPPSTPMQGADEDPAWTENHPEPDVLRPGYETGMPPPTLPQIQHHPGAQPPPNNENLEPSAPPVHPHTEGRDAIPGSELVNGKWVEKTNSYSLGWFFQGGLLSWGNTDTHEVAGTEPSRAPTTEELEQGGSDRSEEEEDKGPIGGANYTPPFVPPPEPTEAPTKETDPPTVDPGPVGGPNYTPPMPYQPAPPFDPFKYEGGPEFQARGDKMHKKFWNDFKWLYGGNSAQYLENARSNISKDDTEEDVKEDAHIRLREYLPQGGTSFLDEQMDEESDLLKQQNLLMGQYKPVNWPLGNVDNPFWVDNMQNNGLRYKGDLFDMPVKFTGGTLDPAALYGSYLEPPRKRAAVLPRTLVRQ